MERMVAANYRLILTRADRYCVERTRPGEPAGKTSEAVAAHWKRELAKKYVEKPCGDLSTS